MFALQVVGASYGNWTSDEYRHVIERMGASEYLGTSYYEHWLTAVETLLICRGAFTEDELVEARAKASVDRLRTGAAHDETPVELIQQV